MKKKIIVLIMALLLVLAFTTGCSKSQAKSDDTLKVTCTIFPQYDWVKQILGDDVDNADITLLLDNGVDLHNYQPTTQDINTISQSDIFIYVGGESDEWVDDVLAAADNKDLIAINLMDVLAEQIKEEELVEGMEAAHEAGEEGDDHEHEHDHEHEYDEHVWLSVKNAAVASAAIKDALVQAKPEKVDLYTNNCNTYIEKLNALDNEYQTAVDTASRQVLLFGDRFPFRYLVDDYGLTYYAAFIGCSAETEASFETMAFLTEKVNALDIPVVLKIEGSDGKIAETIIENSEKQDQQVLTLNSLQSVTQSDLESGISYLSEMQKNLEVLKTALN